MVQVGYPIKDRPMPNKSRFTPHYPLTLLIALFALVTWTGLRVVLWLITGPGQINAAQTLTAFGVGFWFDLAALAFIAAPLLLATALYPDRWRGSRWSHRLYWKLGGLALAVLLFGAVSEIVFWQEFTTRFNFIAVDYLIYTNEVIGNIIESYPVGWILLAIAAAAVALMVWVSRHVSPPHTPLGWRRRAASAGLALVFPLLSWNLASVDQMESTGNAYADELSGNGLFTLAAAMRRNALDYDKFYKTMPQQDADRLLHSLGVERAPLTDVLAVPPETHEPDELGPFRRHPRNIVLISVESLSAKYLGAYGNDQGLTPNLDRFAREGLKFEKVYATGTRTVRGLDALSLGTPPIPGQAIVRRPGNQHLSTIGELLEHQGYASYFFYGGYGYFDNMNAYFRGNDYKVVDRTDFPDASVVFENVWGVADEVLFDNTLPVLDATASRGRPFFAHVMTTSNHRPYTYPDGRIDIPSPGGRKGAVKYTDYAIGRFIEQARTKSWFKDTLFVIVADHCASVAGKTRLPMDHYRIPLIFYAPDLLQPGVHRRMVSQIDVPPTLLDLLGAKGDQHFFGQSVFEAEQMPERAFISNYQELGYYRDGLLTVLSPKQRVSAFHIDPETDAATPAAVDPQREQEAVAFYQTAARAFKKGELVAHEYQDSQLP